MIRTSARSTGFLPPPGGLLQLDSTTAVGQSNAFAESEVFEYQKVRGVADAKQNDATSSIFDPRTMIPKTFPTDETSASTVESNRRREPFHQRAIVSFGYGGSVVVYRPRKKMRWDSHSMTSSDEMGGDYTTGSVQLWRHLTVVPDNWMAVWPECFFGRCSDDQMRNLGSVCFRVSNSKDLTRSENCVWLLLENLCGSLSPAELAQRLGKLCKPVELQESPPQPSLGVPATVNAVGRSRSIELASCGRIREAIDTAIGSDQWDIALLLSSANGGTAYTETLLAYSQQVLANNHTLRVLSLALAGRLNAADIAVGDWIANVTTLLTARSLDLRHVMLGLADSRKQELDIWGAHFCSILGQTWALSQGKPRQNEELIYGNLIGSDPGLKQRTFGSSKSALAAYMYQSWINRKKAQKSPDPASWKRLQPFLLKAVVELVECGRLDMASQWIGAMSDILNSAKGQGLYTVVFLHEFEETRTRLHALQDSLNGGHKQGSTMNFLGSLVTRNKVNGSGSATSRQHGSRSGPGWESIVSSAIGVIAPEEAPSPPHGVSQWPSAASSNAGLSLAPSLAKPPQPSDPRSSAVASSAPLQLNEGSTPEGVHQEFTAPPTSASRNNTAKARSASGVNGLNDQSAMASTSKPPELRSDSDLHASIVTQPLSPKRNGSMPSMQSSQRDSDVEPRGSKQQGRRESVDVVKPMPKSSSWLGFSQRSASDVHDARDTKAKQDPASESSKSSRWKVGDWVMSKLGPRKQAHLGGENDFYYNEELGRWVERGKEHEASQELPPPPPKVESVKRRDTDSRATESPGSQEKEDNNRPAESRKPAPRSSARGRGSGRGRGRGSARTRYVDTLNRNGPAKDPSGMSAAIPAGGLGSLLPAAPDAMAPGSDDLSVNDGEEAKS